MINIYRKGIGFRRLKIYSDRTGSKFCLEMSSVFETGGFFERKCLLRSSLNDGKEILINIKEIQEQSPSFSNLFKLPFYEGNIMLDGKNIGDVVICDNDDRYASINLTSGSKINLCAKTKEKSCRQAFLHRKAFSIISQYNGNEVIEMVDPGAKMDMFFGIKLFGFNKIGTVNPDIFGIEEKDIIFQTIPLCHFIIYDKYIDCDDPPRS